MIPVFNIITSPPDRAFPNHQHEQRLRHADSFKPGFQERIHDKETIF